MGKLAALALIGSAGVLAASLSGCAGQLAGQSQLSYELSQARDDASAQRAQVTALEARLALLEREAVSKRAREREDAPVLAKLDQLIRVNEQVVQRLSAAGQASSMNSSLAPATANNEGSAASEDACAEGLSPEEQLERLVRRMHGHDGAGFRGGLSLEQSQALRVLLRKERELDARSPWQAW